jgi:type II secretory pathway component PulF
MAGFRYIVKDVKGSRLEGSMKAATLDEAIDKLTRDGNVIISINAAQEGASVRKLSLFDKLLFTIYKIRTGIKLKTLVFFTRQISTMFSAGLTIEKSISNLEKSESNKRFKKVLKTISTNIKKGFSLSEALEQHPGVFNSLYIALVKAGEVSGTLHTVLDELAEYLEKIEDTRQKVISAFIYPIVVLSFTFLVIFALFYFIIPLFADVYESFNAELPYVTRLAINISKYVAGNLIGTILLIVAFLVVCYLFYLADKSKYIIDKILLKLLVLGPILRNSIYSKFARTFSILIASGVPIMETLELVEDVVQNGVIAKAIKNARIWIKEGYSVNGAFRRTKEFPPLLVQLLETGEETGEIDKLLAKGAEFYQKMVDRIFDRLTSLIQPLLIIAISLLVGFILVVIYLPIFNLGLAMSSGLK